MRISRYNALVSLADSVRETRLFSHFSEPQVQVCAKHASFDWVPAEKNLFTEGEATDKTFALVAGDVQLRRETRFGAFSLGSMGAGALFGERNFLKPEPSSVSAVTVKDSQVLTLDSPALRAAAAEDVSLNLALLWATWKSLAEKLRRSNSLITQFFAAEGSAPKPADLPKNAGAGDFRVAVADKRKLFEEQRLSSMEINFLSSLSRERKLQAGEVIFREGDAGDHMYILLEGSVRISKRIPGVGEEALAILERGDIFGEMALIDELPRSADAKAHKPSIVLSVSHEVLSGLLNIHQVSSVRLLSTLSALLATRVHEVDEKLVTWFVLAGGSGPKL